MGGRTVCSGYTERDLKLAPGERLEHRDLPTLCHGSRPYNRCVRGVGRAVSAFSQCGHNLLRAVAERSFLVKDDLDGSMVRPRPPVDGFWSALQWRADALASKVGAHLQPLSADAFISRYSGSKRAGYQKASDSLRVQPLTPRDARISGFVKVEPTDGTEKEPVPRLISARDRRYGLELGRYLMRIEEKLYHAFTSLFSGPTGSPVILKGLNLRERAKVLRAKWDSIGEVDTPVAISIDANRFDQHVSVDALRWEHSIYKQIYGDAYLDWMLSMQLVNTGTARQRDGTTVTWTVNGVRQSGDMNTSLGNCLIMATLACTYLQALGVRGEIANDGDDTVFIVGGRDADRVMREMEHFFDRAGFSVRVEGKTDVFERIEFCQCRPVKLYDGWCMVRKPWRALQNMGSGVGKWAQANLVRQMLWAQGVSGTHVCQGVPIMQDLYWSLFESGIPPKRARILREHGMALQGLEMAGSRGLRGNSCAPRITIPDETRISFWEAFGLYPYQQRIIEKTGITVDSGAAIYPETAWDWPAWRDHNLNTQSSIAIILNEHR